MKRALQEEDKCRRVELRCQLYSIMKELDRSLKSECNYTKPAELGPSGGTGYLDGHGAKDLKKRKGSQCCCPPGCCQESLEFRKPRLPPKDQGQGQGQGQDQGLQEGEGTGYLGWHDESHAWGCRPVGEAWPGSQCGRWCSEDSNSYGSPNSSPGSPAVSGYSSGSPNSGGSSPTTDFQFPRTPEEALARGCFVARSA